MDKYKVKYLKNGNKVILTLLDIFNKPYNLEGTVYKEPYHHGYNCSTGGWSSTPYCERIKKITGWTDSPCFKVDIREKYKRKYVSIIAIDRIRDIELIKEG